MKKITKRILIASAVTAGTGVVFMGVGIALGGWPGVVFTKGGIHSPYEQKTPYRQEKKEIEPFSELSLYVGSEADVVVMASKDEKYYVEYTLDGNYGKPKCELTNGKLSIAQQDHNGYMTGMFGLNLGENLSGEKSYITVYIPKGTLLETADIYNDYGNVNWSNVNGKKVSIEADSGNVKIEQSETTSMKLTLNDGDAFADKLKAETFTLQSDYGDSTLSNVSDKTFTVQSECGDVKTEQSETTSMELILNDGDVSVDGLKAETFVLQSEYGDSTISDVSGKVFTVQSECGEVELDRVLFEKMKVEALDGDVLSSEISCSFADVTLEYGDLRWDAQKLENLTCQAECGDVDLILPEELEKYEVDLQIEYGDLSLPKDTPHDQYREEDGEVSYRISASEKNAGKKISVINEEGDVKVRYR